MSPALGSQVIHLIGDPKAVRLPKIYPSIPGDTGECFLGEKSGAFLKNGPTLAYFSFIFGLFKQTLQFFTTNICEKMSIQYTVPGFKPHNLQNVSLLP